MDPSFWQALPKASSRSPIPLGRSHWSWVFKGKWHPDFQRSPKRPWERFRPEELASAQGFESPLRVWKWYQHRRHSAERAAPHAGHRVLSWLEKTLLFWQSLLRMSMVSIGVLDPGKSSNCMEAFTEAFATSTDTRHMRAGLSNQVIPSANSVAVGYAQMWYGLEKTSVRQHYKEPARRQTSESVFVIGTSSQVYPAAGLAWMAKAAGATLVEINLSAHHSVKSRFFSTHEGFGGPGDTQGAATASRRPDIRSNQPIEPAVSPTIRSTRPSPFQSAA